MTIKLLIFVAAFVGMEGVAWFTHKYIMHGFLWSLHRSHHEPNKGLEKNDWFGVFFACIAIILIYIGFPQMDYYFWLGLGITAYGFAYFIFHDIIVHQRLNVKLRQDSAYLKKITRAHKLHHKNMQQQDGKFFGFLFVRGLND